MVRRIENARERFGKAAIELFRTRGYAETTVPQIAAAAGLTERTFFRYFIDKPEVLFWRAGELEAEIVEAIAGADADQPLALVVGALKTAGRFFDENVVDVVTRQDIVVAHADLQARELMKMRSLAAAIGAALMERGIAEPTARMVAEAGVVIWRVALERWRENPAPRSFPHHVQACLGELVAVARG
jgi:AcrR family transcriptional regulator